MKGFTGWKLSLLDRMSADHRLSATDFRVAFRLLHYMDAESGDCFPAQQTIIADTGLGERAVRYALTSLCACGWLKIERTGSRKRGRAQNHYCFPGRDYRHSVAGKEVLTTGTPAREYRHQIAGASLIEHVESKNTLDKGEVRKRTTTPERGSRIPENFSPDISIALAEGMTPQEARRSALNFLDYWKSKPGAAGRKLDWGAAWRIWARKDATKAQRNGPGRQQRPHIAEQAFEAALQAHEREQNGGLFDDVEPTDDAAGYIPQGQRH